MDSFVKKIISIEAPAQNIFGGAIPGLSGSSAGANQGSATSGGDVMRRLKSEAISLARKKNGGADKEELLKAAKDVEALLLIEETLSVISNKQASDLINQLYEAVDA